MSKIEQIYADNAIQKMVVDSLQKDGAFCSYYEKYYLENETYKGGTGDRLSFKKYNDKIINYHNILKILIGERRANIYESIPVIDYIHPENTGFKYVYSELKDDKLHKIDPSKIIPIVSYDNESALNLIENEDPYTINRALIGNTIAEHFYNTAEELSDNFNLQVDIPNKSTSYMYKGIKIPPVIMNGEEISGTRKTSIMIYQINSPVDVYFNPMDSSKFNRVDYKRANIDNKYYIVDSSNNNNYIILNTDCGWNSGYSISSPITFEGNRVVTKNTKSSSSNGTYYLSLQTNDILVILPGTSYSLAPNKIIVLRSSTDKASYIEQTKTAIEGYLNPTNGLFYKDSQYSKQITPVQLNIYLDINSKLKGEIKYYQYDASLKKYFEVDSSYLTPVDDTGLTFTFTISLNPYTCFLLYVEGFNYELDNYADFTEIQPGEELTTLLGNNFAIKILKNYLSIDSLYSADASGLLNGLFCEPAEYSPDKTLVKKWKFIDETDLAEEDGSEIEIGCKYYSGHLLGKGYIKDEPLKLTNSDFLIEDSKTYYAECSGKTPTLESIGIKGKASLIYKKLINEDIITRLFQSSEFEKLEWSSFDNNLITSVITKFDYSNEKLEAIKAKDLVGTANPYVDGREIGSTMAYKNKFYRNGKTLEYDDFIDYIKFFETSIQGHTLVLDSTKQNNVLISNGTTKNKKMLLIEGSEEWEAHDSKFKNNNDTIANEFDKTFAATYYVHYKSDGTTVVDRKYPYITTVSPLDLVTRAYLNKDGLSNLNKSVKVFFNKKLTLNNLGLVASTDNNYSENLNTDLVKNPWSYIKKASVDDAVLVFPEMNKYFPENVLLISGKDLKLQKYSTNPSNPTRGICSLLNVINNKVILFEVSQVKELKFSEITQVNLTSKECSNLSFSYDGSTISEDCYIYFLKPLSLNANGITNIKLYDWNDKLIDISSYEKSNKIVAASYPEDYFPIKIKEATDGTYYYEIDGDKNKIEDFNYLWGSVIIPGLPKFNSYEDLSTCKKDSYSLELIAKLIYGNKDGSGSITNQNISSLIKRLLNSIISTWPISDGKNPLLVKDLPDLLKGIIDFGNEIRNFSTSKFEINVKGKTITITPESLYNFINRIENSDEDSNKEYKLILPTEEDYSKFTDAEKKDIIYNDAFECVPDVIKRRLNQVKIQVIKNRLIEKRPSFITLYNVFKNLSTNKNCLTIQNCIDLDSYIGNNTRAFLDIGDYTPGQEDISKSSSRFSIFMNNLYDSTVEIIKNVINEAFTIKDSYIKSKQLSILRNNYALYYTTESVLEAVKLDSSSNLIIDNDKLKINPSTTESRYELSQLKIGRPFISGKSWVIKAFGYDKYSTLTLDSFIDSNVINKSEDYNLILKNYNTLLEPTLLIFKNDFSTEIKSANATIEIVKKYLSNDDSTDNISLNYNLTKVEGENLEYDWKTVAPKVSPKFEYTKAFGTCPIENAPTYYSYDESTNKYTKLDPQPQAGDNVSNYYITKRVSEFNLVISSVVYDKYFKRIKSECDINEDTLWGIAEFVKMALEGTNANNSNNNYGVKYIERVTETPIGRENSLYYKRYEMLNNRMNRLKGNLWLAASFLRNESVFTSIKNFSNKYVESYNKFINVMPVADIESLTYMPTQEATASTIQLDGKFYSDKELEALKSLINSVCTLSCTSCQVKDACPFYDQNEVIKMYCTGIETIDIWVKDNELDLIAEDEDAIQISEYTSDNISFSRSKLATMHYPYSEIREKVITDYNNSKDSVYYNINDLVSIRENLESVYGADYTDYVTDDLDWLANARYGTVERNSIKDLLIDPDTNEILNDELTRESIERIHPYKFMYNALYIKSKGYTETGETEFNPDDDSYIKYTSSYHRYPFSFETGLEESRKLYEGTTKIKIPVALKIISYANDEDDLYLVSDDKKDANGKEIYPVIYLGKIKDIQWSFDLTDDGVVEGAQSSDDTKLYAADVAQWCMNYYKGNCYEYPVGGWKNSPIEISSNYKDKDQYWMEKIYKNIGGQWYEFNGRPRVISGYSEPLISEDNFDEIQSISGKPMVADFIDFVRKVSIRMYDSSNHTWLIPWVNNTIRTTKDKELDAETQRSVLPLMKTNLRLVVIKS